MPNEIDLNETNGALFTALAKAQIAFPPINRNKEVRVTSERTGKSYTFKYAPLDAIFDAVRKPLADNGLAISQLLDGDDLVTMLLHSDGGSLVGRMPLRATNGTAQELGSAITYLRRYAIQALLGIAAEEDDDGNRAAGNSLGSKEPPALEQAKDGSLIGIAETGKGSSDFELRQTDEDGHEWVIAFRLVSGRKSIQVIAYDALASALAAVRESVIDQRVQCWGVVADRDFTPKGTTKKIKYQVLTLRRISTPDFVLPAPDVSDSPSLTGGTGAEPDAAGGGSGSLAPQIPASDAPAAVHSGAAAGALPPRVRPTSEPFDR